MPLFIGGDALPRIPPLKRYWCAVPKRRSAMGVVMSELIRNQLYRPSVVLPMVALMQVMVSQDFNLGQVGWVFAARGAQAALQRSRELICAVHCHA
ncbi:hypothetical protein QF000_007609 [Paraburkholderia atlantica]|uniref:Uncharacterized protein n=3 Tax=Paraburkholderia TaxID=1822464 RepID=D5W998_PARAM|nr:hypothetical protein BC1002_1930 [Paraburkholderia atlantica]MBB5506270.1 hypothetical protein [Paraburkholderia atlantica]